MTRQGRPQRPHVRISVKGTAFAAGRGEVIDLTKLKFETYKLYARVVPNAKWKEFDHQYNQFMGRRMEAR